MRANLASIFGPIFTCGISYLRQIETLSFSRLYFERSPGIIISPGIINLYYKSEKLRSSQDLGRLGRLISIYQEHIRNANISADDTIGASNFDLRPQSHWLWRPLRRF